MESQSETLSLSTFALYISKMLSILFGHYFGNEKHLLHETFMISRYISVMLAQQNSKCLCVSLAFSIPLFYSNNQWLSGITKFQLTNRVCSLVDWWLHINRKITGSSPTQELYHCQLFHYIQQKCHPFYLGLISVTKSLYDMRLSG